VQAVKWIPEVIWTANDIHPHFDLARLLLAAIGFPLSRFVLAGRMAIFARTLPSPLNDCLNSITTGCPDKNIEINGHPPIFC
jgi:hypothetical protein